MQTRTATAHMEAQEAEAEAKAAVQMVKTVIRVEMAKTLPAEHAAEVDMA